MRLEDMTPAHVRRAIAMYVERAYPQGPPGPRGAAGAGARPRVDLAPIEEAGTVAELLARFERPRASEEAGLQRYTLRLGNRRYPFMKFVVQEYLVDEEYFFSVDTHDDLDVRADSPDYDAWLELKRHNAELKRRIEAAWAREGLPTHTELRLIAEGLARVERGGAGERARILVVDDEAQVALSLQLLLEARGYDVEVCFDGRAVLQRLEREPLPDLILLDYALPEVGGEQVLARVRTSARTRDMPVLLATASSIDLARLPRASGLLRKPYARDVLFAMLRRLLEARAAAGRGDSSRSLPSPDRGP